MKTDIAGGPAALLLSGVSTREMGEAWKPKVDVIAEDLGKLVE